MLGARNSWLRIGGEPVLTFRSPCNRFAAGNGVRAPAHAFLASAVHLVAPGCTAHFLRGWLRIGGEIVDSQVSSHYILCWQRNRVEKSSWAAELGCGLLGSEARIPIRFLAEWCMK